MAVEAGRGEQHTYKIVPHDASDQAKLTAGSHYVGVDAISWFINKKVSWFSNRLASGCLHIKMAGGSESYPVALGVFNLSGGSRIAPVVEKPILRDRSYRGGSISFSTMLCAVNKNDVVRGMIKSATEASLEIVYGMVETATLTGPTGVLCAAGEDIIGNVQKVLTDTSLKCETLFDFSGSEYYLSPEAMVGPQAFILFHRGENLDERRLSVKFGVDLDKPGISVKPQSQILMPYYEDAPLEDGAWLMLRIRRCDEYTGFRDWFRDVGELLSRIKRLVDDVKAGLITENKGLVQLRRSVTGDKTILDEFFRLRSIICNDGVISEREAAAHVGLLYIAIVAAKEAIQNLNPKILTDTIAQARKALSQGQSIEGKIGKAFADEVASVSNVRKPCLAKDTSPSRIAKLYGDELFSNMQYLPKTFKRCTL
ncbi:MAG: hypothetical protein JSV54_07145 [Chloroflexota bacterium]|nr:MAG: hypothetical protein JSV54_07145 [Chloroflexota bacterium]